MSIKNPCASLDRLASLIQGISVEAVYAGPEEAADLSISDDVSHVVVGPSDRSVVSITLSPSASHGPFSALVGESLTLKGEAQALARLLVSETQDPRCGTRALRDAYVKAMIIHLLRDEIAAGHIKSGPLAGLSDPRLSRAIVAMHDNPGRNWQAADLADLAGMSRAAFMRSFRTTVGETPISYLRHWRLDRAREALLRGERVGQVARSYGYGSPDAFSRAFNAAEGVLPSDVCVKGSDQRASFPS
ncbi:helix-turn-helix transcriptional regulator [uncultured Cohaesibacter sp.]|uniref:helix-turn-helix transcriptional regulator n=1 Tax=uncultured Cohaesibacter sp. TaxID=1002546 RepID=UPI0029C78A3F|nr:helix-turn-helix transcriptional regulator [uncultured Cohaesibacter sp.]